MKKLKQIGINAKNAFHQLNNLDPIKINKILNTYNQLLLKNKRQILKQNSKDVKSSIRKHLVDRLMLNEKRIDGIRNSINDIIRFKNPLNKTLENFKRPNGLRIKKIIYMVCAKNFQSRCKKKMDNKFSIFICKNLYRSGCIKSFEVW